MTKVLYAVTGLALMVGGLVAYQQYQSITAQPAPQDTSSKELVVSDESAQTTAEDGKVAGEQQTTIQYMGVNGKDAMELLKENATVVTKDSSFGEYVDSINGIQGGTDSKYWIFYVNDQMSQVGAADYKTQEGDLIEWRFE